MNLEECFAFLADNDIRIKGTRIGIETVLYDYLYRGDSPAAIAARYPSLTPEQVDATIRYYLCHKEAVSGYLAAWLAQGREARAAQAQHPPAVVVRLRRLAAERRAANAGAT